MQGDWAGERQTYGAVEYYQNGETLQLIGQDNNDDGVPKSSQTKGSFKQQEALQLIGLDYNDDGVAISSQSQGRIFATLESK